MRFVDRYRGLLKALQSCRQLEWNIQTDNLSNAHAAQAVGTKSGATAGPFEACPDVNELGGSFRLQSDLPKAQLLEVCGKLLKEILQPGGCNPDGSMAHRLLTTFDVFPKNDLYHDTKLLQEGPRMIFRGSTVAQCISRGIREVAVGGLAS